MTGNVNLDCNRCGYSILVPSGMVKKIGKNVCPKCGGSMKPREGL